MLHLLSETALAENADECKITYKDGPPFYNQVVPVFSANWHGTFNYFDPVQQKPDLDLLVSVRKQPLVLGLVVTMIPHFHHHRSHFGVFVKFGL